MKITYRRYLFIFSVALIVITFSTLDIIFSFFPYSDGGIKQFNQAMLNKTLPFFEMKNKFDEVKFDIILFKSLIFKMPFIIILTMIIVHIMPYFIILICSYKMIRYVNLYSNFDSELKIMVKQLTKTLIILPYRNAVFNRFRIHPQQ
uniref:ABC transmembrane type-1 domain-containing protein n=1 Tax=Meloidogyne hapla TaxID=6305 RepID=A0A1I8B519_MELHA